VGTKPWYADGLRFECQPDCGACCTNHDEHAYVYLDEVDEIEMSGFLELSIEEFRALHTDLDDGERILRMDGPDCPFLQGARCTVYPVRPRQCRTFPFWEENLASPAAWKRTARFCPGIDRGETHGLTRIRRKLISPGWRADE